MTWRCFAEVAQLLVILNLILLIRLSSWIVCCQALCLRSSLKKLQVDRMFLYPAAKGWILVLQSCDTRLPPPESEWNHLFSPSSFRTTKVQLESTMGLAWYWNTHAHKHTHECIHQLVLNYCDPTSCSLSKSVEYAWMEILLQIIVMFNFLSGQDICQQKLIDHALKNYS